MMTWYWLLMRVTGLVTFTQLAPVTDETCCRTNPGDPTGDHDTSSVLLPVGCTDAVGKLLKKKLVTCCTEPTAPEAPVNPTSAVFVRTAAGILAVIFVANETFAT